jgi:hypothetical protein
MIDPSNSVLIDIASPLLYLRPEKPSFDPEDVRTI